MATPEEMAAKMRENLPEKTGKSINEWLKLLKSHVGKKHGELVKFLKAEYEIGHGFANLIAHDFLNQGCEPSEGDLVSSQYAGAKAGLKPIYDAIIKKLAACKEMEIAPKKTYVSLRRNKQFAIIQPSTKTRIDVGINLKDHPTTDRLEASGSFNQMVSHRVRIEDIKQVDAELIGWIKEAYKNS